MATLTRSDCLAEPSNFVTAADEVAVYRLSLRAAAEEAVPVGVQPAGATSVRCAGPADAAVVADLLIRARAAAAGYIPAAVHSDDEVRAWVAAVVLPESEVWVSLAGGDEVVAVMVLGDGWVDQLYVDPEWTGRGIGGQLIELAKRRQPRGLQLWTFVTNVPAQRFYQRHGFAVVETTDGSGNEEKQPDLRLIWPAP